jgi:hypothetical protein
MRAECLWNNLTEPPYRKKEIDEAVSSGIGDRLDGQSWSYSIGVSPNTSAIGMSICGPGGFKWECVLDGPDHQTPEFINRMVKAKVPPYGSSPDRG